MERGGRATACGRGWPGGRRSRYALALRAPSDAAYCRVARVVAGGPAAYFSTLPIKAMLLALQREQVAAEMMLVFAPTPGTWMWAWDNDLREDAPLDHPQERNEHGAERDRQRP